MKVNGKIIRCMEKVHLSGLMEESMLVNIIKIKNMALEEFNGRMEKFIKVIGEKVFKMVKEKLGVQTEYNVKVSGKMERE